VAQPSDVFMLMLTFIYVTYSMMALFYETVPAFEDTWIECLGDLYGTGWPSTIKKIGIAVCRLPRIRPGDRAPVLSFGDSGVAEPPATAVGHAITTTCSWL